MSSTGLEVFDRTLQATHVWLDEIMARLGPDRQLAWKVLSVVLQKLRDRLQPGLASHLGAQLPLLVRGAYFDHYEPSKQPAAIGSADEFVHEVGKWLSDARVVDPKDAIEAVFGVLERHISAGEIAKVRQALPRSIRALWPVEQAIAER